MANTFLTNHVLNKVPLVTAVFWLIKVLSTTVGETAADYLSVDLNFGMGTTSLIMLGLLAIFLSYQIIKNAYTPWIYWTNIVLVSVAGTLITDNMVDNYGVTLETASLLFTVLLALTFWLWHRTEGTLSITSIHTRKREMFYWVAILFTFALGTAVGDLAAEGMHLGFSKALLMFAAIIGFIAIMHYLFDLNAILSFWLVYILTRPLGASLGDLLSQPMADGGLALGAMTTSMIFLGLILSGVTYLTLRSKSSGV